MRTTFLVDKFIQEDPGKALLQAVVISRLGYRNTLLHIKPLFVINHLHRVESCAARLMICTCKREHITPVLFQLHWLAVRHKSMYKILFYVFQVLHGCNRPANTVKLSDLVQRYRPVRQLRSGFGLLLKMISSQTKVYNNLILRVSAPALWNGLPDHVKFLSIRVLKTQCCMKCCMQCQHNMSQCFSV